MYRWKSWDGELEEEEEKKKILWRWGGTGFGETSSGDVKDVGTMDGSNNARWGI